MPLFYDFRSDEGVAPIFGSHIYAFVLRFQERRGRRSLRFLSYFNISNSVASSMTVTPSSLALVSLEPAASPATT